MTYAPILAPFIALIGAIWLYFRKLADDRAEARRKERIELYSELLTHANLVWSRITGGPPYQDLSKEHVRFGPILNRMRLVAPDEVYAAAVLVRDATGAFGQYALTLDRANWLAASQGGRLLPYIERVGQHEIALVDLMRADVSPPTTWWQSRFPAWRRSGIESLGRLTRRRPPIE